MQSKVLMINPFQVFNGSRFENEFPTHLVHLATFLKANLENQVDIQFLDFIMERLINKNLSFYNENFLKNFLKDFIDVNFTFNAQDTFFIVLSCLTSFQYVPSKMILDVIKKLEEEKAIPPAYVVVGGYHPSVMAGDFKGLGVDYLVRGEGEIALLDIVRRDRKKPYHKQMEKKLIVNVINGTPIQNMDDLPRTNFNLYNRYLKYYPHVSVALSRGCPRQCAFCVEDYLQGLRYKRWRSFSIQKAKEEIDNLINVTESQLGQNSDGMIGFYDPIFGFNLRWREKILQYLIDKNNDYKYWAETRIDAIKRKHVSDFKRANLYFMFGLESGSKQMLFLMNKSNNPSKYLDNAAKFLNLAMQENYGPLIINLIFNFPGETKNTLDESFNFLTKLVDDGVFFLTNHLTYGLYPGDNIFQHLNYWKTFHGTKIHYPTWWKTLETSTFGDIIDASRSFSFNQANNQIHSRLTSLLRKSIDIAPGLPYRIEMIRRLKQQKNSHHRKAIGYENSFVNA